jgi:hypothetical protein
MAIASNRVSTPNRYEGSRPSATRNRIESDRVTAASPEELERLLLDVVSVPEELQLERLPAGDHLLKVRSSAGFLAGPVRAIPSHRSR